MKTQVAAAIAVLIATALGAVLVATTRLVTNQSLRRGSEDLVVARTAFNYLVAARAASAAAQLRLITAQPIFRAYLSDMPSADDLAILRTMADQYPNQLGAAFCVVADRQGAWLAEPGWSQQDEPPGGLQSAIRSAADGRPQSIVVTISGRLVLVVAEPARFAQETLGAMAVGLALDDSVARELADITQSEVGLVAGQRLSGSSLHGEGRAQLTHLLEVGDPAAVEPAPSVRRLGAVTYVSGVFPLMSTAGNGGSPRLVLLRDWAPTQQFLDELRRQFLGAGLIVFACALAGGFLFSRSVSQPFQDIAAAARDIASGGNWKRQVPVRGSAEAMTTASAFNDMSISLRHWYEEAQAKSERLQASYDRFHAVTESVRDAIVSTDDAGSITFWNRSAALIFGYGEAAALGRPLAELVAPADRSRCLDACASLGPEGEAPVGSIIEMTGLRSDGTMFPMELSLSATPVDGRVPVTVVIRDITERKRAQEALQQRDEQLRQAQKMEAIGRLAGGVAHDFNNLLTAIRGFSTLVRDGLNSADPLRSDIDEVLSATDRAAALTRQLLAFSRRQVVTPQVVALDKIVVGTEKLLHRLIGEDVVLTSTSTPGLGLVRADPGQVEQVLINLCINARDAMQEGGTLRIALDEIEIDAAASSGHPGMEPGPYVRLTVADSGCGMDFEVMRHIFEPFFTTKKEGKGTGLGLATVYGIVKQGGGHVEVDSHPGQGTTFQVYFPRVDGNERGSVDGVVTPEVAPASETVLLVEDDDRVRGLVATILRRKGYNILEASRGEEALELARQHVAPIHLLLSDVVMPGMSGRVVAARVAELRAETRILLMSGYSDETVTRSGAEGPQVPFIQKPFSTEALAAKIRETLSGDSVG